MALPAQVTVVVMYLDAGDTSLPDAIAAPHAPTPPTYPFQPISKRPTLSSCTILTVLGAYEAVEYRSNAGSIAAAHGTLACSESRCGS